MLAGGGYNAGSSSQNSATISIIIAWFPIVPAVCYLLSAIVATRFYALKTPFLFRMMAELAQGARRNEQEFTELSANKEFQN